MRNRFWIVAALLTLSISAVPAVAGKLERDTMTKKILPALAKAEDKFKAACGCPIKMTIDETTIDTTDLMYRASGSAGWIASGAEQYCTDDASKKAVCQLKTLLFLKGKTAAFTFKGGAGQCTTDGQASCSWGQITRVLDK
jgi:hypothetical protein